MESDKREMEPDCPEKFTVPASYRARHRRSRMSLEAHGTKFFEMEGGSDSGELRDDEEPGFEGDGEPVEFDAEVELEYARIRIVDTEYELQQSATVGQFLLTRNEELEHELERLRQQLTAAQAGSQESPSIPEPGDSFDRLNNGHLEGSSGGMRTDIALQATLLARNEDLEQENEELREQLHNSSTAMGRRRPSGSIVHNSCLEGMGGGGRARSSTSDPTEEFQLNRNTGDLSNDMKTNERIHELMDHNEALIEDCRRLEIEKKKIEDGHRKLQERLEQEKLSTKYALEDANSRRDALAASLEAVQDKRRVGGTHTDQIRRTRTAPACAHARRGSAEHCNGLTRSSARTGLEVEVGPNSVPEQLQVQALEEDALSEPKSPRSADHGQELLIKELNTHCGELQQRVDELEFKCCEALGEISNLQTMLNYAQASCQTFEEAAKEAQQELEREKQRSAELSNQLQELKLVLEAQRKRSSRDGSATPSSRGTLKQGPHLGAHNATGDFLELVHLHRELSEASRSTSRQSSRVRGGRNMSRQVSVESHSARLRGSSMPANDGRGNSLSRLHGAKSKRTISASAARRVNDDRRVSASLPASFNKAAGESGNSLPSSFNNEVPRAASSFNTSLLHQLSLVRDNSAMPTVLSPIAASTCDSPQKSPLQEQDSETPDEPPSDMNGQALQGSDASLEEFHKQARLMLSAFIHRPGRAQAPAAATSPRTQSRQTASSFRVTDHVPYQTKQGKSKMQCKITQVVLSDSDQESPQNSFARTSSASPDRSFDNSVARTGLELASQEDEQEFTLESFLSGVSPDAETLYNSSSSSFSPELASAPSQPLPSKGFSRPSLWENVSSLFMSTPKEQNAGSFSSWLNETGPSQTALGTVPEVHVTLVEDSGSRCLNGFSLETGTLETHSPSVGQAAKQHAAGASASTESRAAPKRRGSREASPKAIGQVAQRASQASSNSAQEVKGTAEGQRREIGRVTRAFSEQSVDSASGDEPRCRFVPEIAKQWPLAPATFSVPDDTLRKEAADTFNIEGLAPKPASFANTRALSFQRSGSFLNKRASVLSKRASRLGAKPRELTKMFLYEDDCAPRRSKSPARRHSPSLRKNSKSPPSMRERSRERSLATLSPFFDTGKFNCEEHCVVGNGNQQSAANSTTTDNDQQDSQDFFCGESSEGDVYAPLSISPGMF